MIHTLEEMAGIVLVLFGLLIAVSVGERLWAAGIGILITVLGFVLFTLAPHEAKR